MRKRLLTGDRPTGKLHLGHYVGTLANRVRLQHEFETFFIIADLHMLTTMNSREDIEQSAVNAHDLVLDALGAGIDPCLATFYLQSGVPEIAKMTLFFQNFVSVPRLERIPSLKEMARDAQKDEMPFGLLVVSSIRSESAERRTPLIVGLSKESSMRERRKYEKSCRKP